MLPISHGIALRNMTFVTLADDVCCAAGNSPHVCSSIWHHLTREGGEHVATHLNPLLAELVD